MERSLQVIQIGLQGGATFALCLLIGCAYAHEHLAIVQEQGRASYWLLFKRGFFIYLLLSTLVAGWLLEEGGAIVDLLSALSGLVVGMSVGLLSATHEIWLHRSLVISMILVATDCLLEALARSYIGGLAGAVLVGVVVALGVAAISFIVFLVTSRFSEQSRVWSLRAPALASLLLVVGSPTLSLVVLAGVLFGFVGGGRYQMASRIPVQAAFLLSLAAVVFVHATTSFYFSFMSSYGIFSHPVVSVSPYALASIAIGVVLHRIGGDTWPLNRRAT